MILREVKFYSCVYNFLLSHFEHRDKKARLSKCAFNLTINIYNIKIHINSICYCTTDLAMLIVDR